MQPWSIFEEAATGEPAAVGQRLKADVLYETLFCLPQASAVAIGYLSEDVLVPDGDEPTSQPPPRTTVPEVTVQIAALSSYDALIEVSQ